MAGEPLSTVNMRRLAATAHKDCLRAGWGGGDKDLANARALDFMLWTTMAEVCERLERIAAALEFPGQDGQSPRDFPDGGPR